MDGSLEPFVEFTRHTAWTFQRSVERGTSGDRNQQVRHVVEDGPIMVLSLRRLASLELVADYAPGQTTPEQNAANQADWDHLYGEMRRALAVLKSPALRGLEAKIRKVAPHVWAQYEPLKARALRNAEGAFAFLSFSLGRGDEAQLGYDFVPMPPLGTRGPSVPLDEVVDRNPVLRELWS